MERIALDKDYYHDVFKISQVNRDSWHMNDLGAIWMCSSGLQTAAAKQQSISDDLPF